MDVNPQCSPIASAETGASAACISVVIPTKNRPQTVEKLIRALAANPSRVAEIIVVDQSESGVLGEHLAPAGATTDKAAILYRHAPEIDGAAAARNAGFTMSSSPYVVFLDDDAIPAPGCLELLVETLEAHPALLAVGGLVSNYSPPPWPARLLRWIFYRPPLRDERQPAYWKARSYARGALIRSSKLTGSCMAFRREALERCGGFDPRYRGPSVGEDVEISTRLLRLAGRHDAIALVGGAFTHHASEGSWKRNPRANEFEIVATHYWFHRNYPRTLANRVRFAWMCTGLLLWSLAASLRRLHAGPLLSFAAGVRSILNGYRGCPFLHATPPQGHCA